MDLEAGEQIIFEGHPSWRSILAFYLKGLVIVVIAGAIAAGVTKATDDEVNTGVVAAVAIVVFVLVVVIGWLRRLATTYTITNKRLYIRRGIVSRHEQQTHVTKVQNVNTNQSIVERLLQVGTVDFDTAGDTDSDFKFAGVADPREVMQAVHRAQREVDAMTAGPTG
jgi:uncharacterized membrane protein YdbT with pleckstrin-like domain